MVMKNFLLGLSKFVLGIILAMLIMTLAGASMMRYFMARTAEPPERPTYDNDLPEERPATDEPTDEPTAEPTAEAPAASVEEAPVAAEPEPEPEPESEPSADGVYTAYVTQPVGLILRDGPSTDYANIGGIGYEESVTVLAEEGGWLNVQLSNGQQGWIKDGNTAR